MSYKLYEYHLDSLKIGLIVSENEQLLYLGSKLYSAKTNVTPDKKVLNSDITGRGLVRVDLNPLKVTINNEQVSPVHEHEESDKYSILQYWNTRLSAK